MRSRASTGCSSPASTRPCKKARFTRTPAPARSPARRESPAPSGVLGSLGVQSTPRSLHPCYSRRSRANRVVFAGLRAGGSFDRHGQRQLVAVVGAPPAPDLEVGERLGRVAPHLRIA